MFNPFKHAGPKPLSPDEVHKHAGNLDIGANGELLVAGLDLRLSEAELDALIIARINELRSAYAALVTHKNQSDTNQSDERTQRLTSLKQTIDSIETGRSWQTYMSDLLNIAGAYDMLAVIDAKTSSIDIAMWDLAWYILNGEALKVAIAASRSHQATLSKYYADILFARAQHCLREMKYAVSDLSRNRNAQIALDMLYTYLVTVYKLGLSTHWQIPDAIKSVHIAIGYGTVTSDQLAAILTNIAQRGNIRSPGQAVAQANEAIQSYTLSDTDKQRLPDLIY